MENNDSDHEIREEAKNWIRKPGRRRKAPHVRFPDKKDASWAPSTPTFRAEVLNPFEGDDDKSIGDKTWIPKTPTDDKGRFSPFE